MVYNFEDTSISCADKILKNVINDEIYNLAR